VVPPGCSSDKPDTIRDFIVQAKAALVSVGIVRDTVLGNSFIHYSILKVSLRGLVIIKFVVYKCSVTSTIKYMRPIFVGNGKDLGRLSGRIIDSDMHEVGRFLNRILGLPPDIQNGSVFCELNCLMVISSGIRFNIINTTVTGYLSYL